jgi:hypothetical protein
MVIGVQGAGSRNAGRRGPALIEIRKIAMQRPAVVTAGHADRIYDFRPCRRIKYKYRRGKCGKNEKMPAHLGFPL